MSYSYPAEISKPANFSSGWNDPPELVKGNPPSSINMLLKRQRRPLDPSIQLEGTQSFGMNMGVTQQQVNAQPILSTPNYSQQAKAYPMAMDPNIHAANPNPFYQGNFPQSNQYQSQPPVQQVQPALQYPQSSQHQQIPQQQYQPILPQNPIVQNLPHNPVVQAAPQTQYQTNTAIIPNQLTTHPASAFTPTSAIENNQINSPTAYNQQQPYNPIYQDDFQNLPVTSKEQSVYSQGAINNLQDIFFKEEDNSFEKIQHSESSPLNKSMPYQKSSKIIPIHSSYDGSTSAFYSPPNTVNLDYPRPITHPDPTTYIPPKKAPGDVSLSGAQLVAFLIKATLRLQEGATREGVQLRIAQFNDLILAGNISDVCLKKLNFIVDAIDREVYDEAWSFFEQFQSQFPNEAGVWTHGIRILILELRKYSHPQHISYKRAASAKQ